MTLISFVDAATMEQISSRSKLFGGALQSTPASVVRMENQAPVAIQPATFLAAAEDVSHQDSHTSGTSCPQSARGVASRCLRARPAIGGRSQHVWWCGECGDFEPEGHDPPGKGQAKIPPPADRIKSCEEFLGRASRRLEKAEEEVAQAIAKKQSVEAEITRAQSDLARMRAELSREPIPRCSESDELERLRGWVNENGTPAKMCQRPS